MPLTRDQVHRAIHKGILDASNDYSNWSDGWTLADSGVEGLLTAGIAKAIYSRKSPHESLLLELPYDLCQQWSGASRPKGRPPKALERNVRADIALFNSKKRTKYVIEVKRMPTKDGLRADLKRLCAIVHKCAGGTLRRGFMAIFHKGMADDNIRDGISSFNTGNAAVLGPVTRRWWESPSRDDDELLFSICVEVVLSPRASL